MLSLLAVVDALLNNKETAISEGRRAVQMLPVAKDVIAGAAPLKNLAMVYSWSEDLDQAFDLLSSLSKMPFGIYYAQLKREPYWEPLRKDPRYQKLLAELVSRDGVEIK